MTQSARELGRDFDVLFEGGLDSMTRNVVVALLAVTGVTLIGLAALDWVGYTGFSVSQLWR